MAVTLHSEPSTYVNLIGNPFVFEFSMTGINTASHVRRLGYQLFDSNGEALSALELITPKEGVNFFIDFKKDLKPFVWTTAPDCAQVFKIEDTMIRFVYIKYWELVFDKETCESVEENTNQTDDYRILNSAENYYGVVNLENAPTYLLTAKPKSSTICKDQCDFVYLWSEGSHRFEVRTFFKDGSFAHSAPIDGNSEAWSYRVSPTDVAKAISPQYIPILNALGRMDIYIDNVLWFTYHIENCCNTNTVWFQQAGGGFSSMTFQEAKITSIETSQDTINKHQPLNQKVHTDEHRQVGGTSIANKKAYKVLKLNKVIESSDISTLRFYEDFLSSGIYYIQISEMESYTNSTETIKLIKFIVKAGNIAYNKEKEDQILEITGKINQTYINPSYNK